MSDDNNPWTRLSSTIVYRNTWIAIREDQVLRPDGESGIYAFLEKPPATGVVALTPQLDVYLVGQYRYPLNQYSWEIIEGGAEEGEDPMAAAKRELQEEAGLVAASWSTLASGLHLSNCITSEEAYLYLARDLSEVGATPEVTEVLKIKRVPFADCLRMVECGEIKDAMTVIAILLVERWLKNQ